MRVFFTAVSRNLSLRVVFKHPMSNTAVTAVEVSSLLSLLSLHGLKTQNIICIEVCLKKYQWCFEDGDVLLRRGWCGTINKDLWYFEECDVVL